LKKLLRGIISVTLTFALMLSVAIVAHAATATLIGPQTGAQVQAKIATLYPGDTLDLSNATITGGFTVDKQITLLGDSDNNGIKATITLEGLASPPYEMGVNFTPAASGSKIDGFIIDPTSSFNTTVWDITIQPGANNITISNNVLKVANGLTVGSTATDISLAVSTYASQTTKTTGLNINHNTIISSNDIGTRPIYINPGCVNTTIDNNTFSGHFEAGVGIEGQQTIISNNTFDSTYTTGGSGYSIMVWDQDGYGNTLGTTSISGNTFASDKQSTAIKLYDFVPSKGDQICISNNSFNSALLNGKVVAVTTAVTDNSTPVIPNFVTNVTCTGYANDTTNRNVYSDTNSTQILYFPPNYSKPIITTVTTPVITITDPFVYVNKTPTPAPATPLPLAPKVKAAKNAVLNVKDSTINVGESFDVMKNVSAIDNAGKGKDITNKVTAIGQINTAVAGTYKVTYSVVGANGKTVTKTVTVTVAGVASTPVGPAKCTPTVPGSP